MNSDISAYTYERTLVMEQRNQMLRELRLNKRQTLGVVQTIVDAYHNVDAKTATKVRFMEPGAQQQANGMVDETQEKLIAEESTSGKVDEICEKNQKSDDGKDVNEEEACLIGRRSPKLEKRENNEKEEKDKGQQNNYGIAEVPAEEKPPITPDEDDVRRMHTAVKLNEVIVNKSHDAQLVILNLPGPPRDTRMERESNYMEFLEVLTEGLERVLMVHGGGREVITIYS